MRLKLGKAAGAKAARRRKRASQAGFTVIETTIAMLILMIASLGVASMFAYAANNNSGGMSRTVALTVAQHRLELLRNLPFDSPQLAATVANPPAQTVTRAGGTFQVVTTIINGGGSAPLPVATVTRKTITVTVTPLGRGIGYAGAPVRLVTTRTAYTNGPYLN